MLPALAHQVDEHPAAFALLDVPRLERRELAPAQCTAQKHCQDRPAPLSFAGLELGFSKQALRLFPIKLLSPDWRTLLTDTIP